MEKCCSVSLAVSLTNSGSSLAESLTLSLEYQICPWFLKVFMSIQSWIKLELIKRMKDYCEPLEDILGVELELDRHVCHVTIPDGAGCTGLVVTGWSPFSHTSPYLFIIKGKKKNFPYIPLIFINVTLHFSLKLLASSRRTYIDGKRVIIFPEILKFFRNIFKN